MEIVLRRTYHSSGTNGILYVKGNPFCCTIELPWRDNTCAISCIPEGRYRLDKRWSKHFNWHLLVRGVPNRSLILIHPANHALRQLQGCIAPVTRYTEPGIGEESKAPCAALRNLVYAAMDRGEEVYLRITSNYVLASEAGGPLFRIPQAGLLAAAA
jgi:hypothetical protein